MELTPSDGAEHVLQGGPVAAVSVLQRLGQHGHLGRAQLQGRGAGSARGAQHQDMWPPWVGPYLLDDALQAGHPGLPEIKLHPGQGVQPLPQLLRWVLAEDLFNLLEPLDDDGLDGVQH